MPHPVLQREFPSSTLKQWLGPTGHAMIHLGEPVRIPDREIEQILRLIAEGESLNLRDLEAFYRWVDDSYNALGFHPLQQQRFDEYCRSSSDTTPTRIYAGVWMLRLALGEAPSGNRSCQNSLASNKTVSHLSRKGSSRSRRRT
jgi:hypothetical protein